ncbi:glycosyltransferase family 2 protein [Egicoccus halophilus]|uniref:Glycosyltransferase 2-like domain-containing protein n=1 Tax=Egicoccus halophilus TaxID=1670830 RepID=A0A8J3A9E6_9ACTN|nr:glycosyltransferase family 2 protein [Egicoccus halophilus]GGI05418.1 hypothetical protein GCM10011354_14000 [Egicoccus halophilus]
MSAPSIGHERAGSLPPTWTPPAVAPVSDGAPRPFWSVMIPTYNGQDHLTGALTSVLEQDPGPQHMQIEVVDDCSPSREIATLVERLGGGRVGYHRQPRNVGHSANFNACVRRSRGEVVHLLHDDDEVRPGFYAALEEPLRQRPELGAAFVRTIYADAEGHWRAFSPVERPEPGVLDDWLRRIAAGQRTTTPAMVLRRRTYERLGGYLEGFRTSGEDWEMWVRVAATTPVWFEPAPLAVYRMQRPGSLSGAARGSDALVRDMLLATDLIARYLPRALGEPAAATALRRARDQYAAWALQEAAALAHAGRRADAWRAGRLAVREGRARPLLVAGLRAARQHRPRRRSAGGG